MNAAFAQLYELDRLVQAMSLTDSPTEVFKVLGEACRLAAPRGAIFLVRQERVHGWSAFGYGPEVLQEQRTYSCALGDGWLGQLVADREASAMSWRAAPGSDPDFGQPSADEAAGCVVRLQGRPVALLTIERRGEESPWHPQAVGLVVTVAQLRLEFDLALRKLASAAGSRPPARPASEPASPAASDQLAPATAAEEQGSPELDAARRYARLVATDIRLYNEEAVVLGRRHGDLVRRLEEHLGRGKETFLRRHGDLGPTGLELLHEAYVQVLAAGDPKLIPPAALE